ncbi:n-terminal amidase [Colletotrichum incanum]|uniref:N-terminal amidase n=1 Tax=Colletotrichum incanum TaxID=1573173 RepID=A0A161WZJ4_COLIC|nr:n-terminal amidase [Colletotrichum incanum]
MRIGCLQFAPQVGDIDNNLNRADSVLSKADTDDLDLLVLPELAFSGYNFKSLQHISPYLEPSGSGITSLWARTTALKYNCNVVVGYPEKVDVSNNWPTGPEYYNSAIVVNGDGETIANYRKSFLYYTDETWALEGNKGFYEGWIPGLGNTSIGICDPYKFQAPWHAFEFAFHVLEYESNLVIVSMAWMTREDGRLFSRMPNEPDMDTLTYWVTRLEPLIRAENEDEIIVVFCNRTGNEEDAVYAGTSAVIGIQDGEVKIYGLLGRGEKELLVVDTNNPPYAKLVYRPEPERPSAVHSELQQAGDSSSSAGQSSSKYSTKISGSKQGFSSHTPTQPTSPPTKPSSASISSQHSPKKSPATRQTKPPPKIQIPHTNASSGTQSRGVSAKSPDSNLPTPTAPSPTPQAIRPKLIIPQSPPLQPWQSGSPVPQSSQSTRSVQSILSNQSITSNPRPPEDSTPYPHSGAPLSGYPNSNRSEKRIYGGSVSITQMPFTPITPFDDQSPMEPRYFWRPSDTLLKTPMESRGRNAVAEPDHTRTQTFHFPLFTHHEPAARTNSSNSMRTVATAGSSRSKKDNDQASKEKKRAPSQNTKARHSSKSRSGDHVGNRAETPAAASQDPFPARPSSPKSRNASRTRMLDRSDSALAHREHANAISQQLGSISQRAESVNKNRDLPEETVTGTPQLDRPSSPKSRNCSRSRPSEHLSSILIAASPSIYGDEYNRRSLPALPDTQKTQPQRPMSRMNNRSRTGSVTENEKSNIRNARPPSRASMSGEQASPRPASRAASRGRQPGSKFSPPKMSPHDPSLSPEQASDEFVRIERDRASSIASKPPISSPASEPTFERVEAIVCPNCPVHGRHSTGSAPGTSSTTSEHRASPDLTSGRSVSSPAATHGAESVTVASNSKAGDDPQFSVTGSENPSDLNSLAETIETISSTSRSPSTPLFEPKTPRAMVIIRDAESFGNGEKLIPDLPGSFSDLICADRNVGPTSDGQHVVAA